jgi:tetratricopeptide (TPR) repeat protein
MISRPLNYLIFTAVIVVISVIVFPFPIRLLEMYSAAGEFDLASEQAAKMLKEEGDARPAFNFMASRAAAEGDPDSLVLYLLRLGRVSVNKPQTYQRLSDVYMWMGKPEQAVNALESKLVIEPGDQKALLDLTDMYQTMDQPDSLARIVEMRLALKPDDLDLTNYLASLQSLLGNFNREIELRRRILDLDPKDHGNLRRLGGLYLATGQTQKGLDEFIKLMDQDPGNTTLAEAALALVVGGASKTHWLKLKDRIIAAMGDYGEVLHQAAHTALANDRADFGAWLVSQLVLEHPRDIAALDLAVELYRRNNQTAQAVDLVERISLEQPDNPALLERLVRLNLEINNSRAAFIALKGLLTLRPDSPREWEQFLKVATWTKDSNDELAALRMRLQHAPRDVKALKRLIDLAQDLGKAQEAKDALIRLAKLGKVKDYKKRLASLERRIKYGSLKPQPIGETPKDAAQRAGGRESAAKQTPPEMAPPELPEDLESIRAMLTKDPRDAELLDHYLKVASYTPLESKDIAHLKKLAENSKDHGLLKRVGKALVAGNKVPHAIPVIEKLARLRPKDGAVRRDLAKYYSWTDQSHKRLLVLLELVELDPQSHQLRLEVVAAALSLGKHQVALEHALWLRERGKLDHEGHLTLAEAYVLQDQKQGALDICGELLKLNAAPKLLARAGEIALGLERPRLARALFAAAMRKAPGQHLYLKQMALAEMALGRAEKAVLLMQAYTRRHRDYEAHYLLGEYLASLGRKAEAQNQFLQAQNLMNRETRVARP